MIDDCAVLLISPTVSVKNAAPMQRRNTCVQCEEAAIECLAKLPQFSTDEAKWKHVWEHVRSTYNVATEPNPSIKAIKNNSQCKAFFHEKCFPLKKIPRPQLERKRSSTEKAIESVASSIKAKRPNNSQLRRHHSPKSSDISNENHSIARRCEACDREIEQTAEIRDRHVWHHLNKPRETADGQIFPPLPRFWCSLQTGANGPTCDWGTYIMLHMESHWREQHPHVTVSLDMPPIVDLSASLRFAFEQMERICFPPTIGRHSEQLSQFESTVASPLLPMVAPRFVGDSQQAVADVDNDEVIAIEEEEADPTSSLNWTDDLPSVYSRPAVARTCMECEVDHFDVAEHCATRHAQIFPFRCGNDHCAERFSSIFLFAKHAAVFHGKKPSNSSNVSLIVNKSQLKILENSITHCFGQLAFDDCYL